MCLSWTRYVAGGWSGLAAVWKCGTFLTRRFFARRSHIGSRWSPRPMRSGWKILRGFWNFWLIKKWSGNFLIFFWPFCSCGTWTDWLFFQYKSFGRDFSRDVPWCLTRGGRRTWRQTLGHLVASWHWLTLQRVCRRCRRRWEKTLVEWFCQGMRRSFESDGGSYHQHDPLWRQRSIRGLFNHWPSRASTWRSYWHKAAGSWSSCSKYCLGFWGLRSCRRSACWLMWSRWLSWEACFRGWRLWSFRPLARRFTCRPRWSWSAVRRFGYGRVTVCRWCARRRGTCRKCSRRLLGWCRSTGPLRSCTTAWHTPRL